jgi:hypothetical protein
MSFSLMNVRLMNVKPARLLVACALFFSCLALAEMSLSCAGQERLRRVNGNGSSILVKAGDNLQAALDGARPGDTILLEAGATFRGTFRLPKKQGAEFITLRSSAQDAQLPAPGQRMDPQRYALMLPKIVSGSNDSPAILAIEGAHHFRFVAVEFGPTPGGQGNIVQLGTGDEKAIEELPHDFEFDRVWVHGHPLDGQRRGISLNARAVKVANSYFSDIKRKGDESQALCGWGGDGPFEITNNYIEAAAEGVLFGGAAPRLRIVPSNITVRGNHFNKPLNWRSEGWLVKNHFELKNARNVKVDNNLMTNNWGGGQDGSAVLFTVRAEEGAAPQATVEDVQFTNNLVRGAGGAFQILGGEGRGGHRAVIRNNLFEDINAQKWSGSGQFMIIADWDGLVIEHNTILTTGNVTKAFGKPTPGLIFRDNIVPQNEYGFHGDDRSGGQDTLDFYFPGSVMTNNAIIGGDASLYRGRNMYPATLKELKFVNPEAGDYRLRPDSPLRRAASDGTDIGASLDPQNVGKV